MTNLNVRIRYRPIRIGWCIRDKNWDDFRLALRLTHVLWGGSFNPIIPVGATSASNLVHRFRVDVLIDVADDSQVKTFMEQFKHLPWPVTLEPGLFNSKHIPNFLDITHPLRKLAEEPQPQGILAEYSTQLTLVHWKEKDPLSDVLLATFGAYPDPSEIGGTDYSSFIKDAIKTSDHWILENGEVGAILLDQRTPWDLSSMDLAWDRSPHIDTMGFYVGSACDFEDIVNFWNLRASDLSVIFLDPLHLARLQSLKDSHLSFIRERQSSPTQLLERLAVWSRSQDAMRKVFGGESISSYWAVDGTEIIQGNFRPPLHFFTRKSVLASSSEQYGKPTLAFQLPDKPFLTDSEYEEQRYVVSVKIPTVEENEVYTFWVPYLSRLNEWFGRNIYSSASSVRAEVEGLGFICEVRDENLIVRAVQKQELAAKIFELGGIKAHSSMPGRIASRLISQLGGFLGCRVLKISGVRRLIKKYGPLQDFGRTDAIFTIGNSDQAGKPHFEDYEGLYIEQRDPAITKLTPEQVFLFMLDKGIFRVGLTLTCPTCELPFWLSLDEISTLVNCELCGRGFNVLRQLKDRDWKYRRSGLFGQENNQEGSIPVALTLQQLETQIQLFDGALFFTNMSLSATTANIQPCETDIFIATQRGNMTELVIGECKDGGGTITLDDATKLAAVADSFPISTFTVYIVFAKTAPFTPNEIENCQSAQKNGLRVILLSDRELEPYYVYEKTSKQFDIDRMGVTLSDMAHVTHDVFFCP